MQYSTLLSRPNRHMSTPGQHIAMGGTAPFTKDEGDQRYAQLSPPPPTFAVTYRSLVRRRG